MAVCGNVSKEDKKQEFIVCSSWLYLLLLWPNYFVGGGGGDVGTHRCVDALSSGATGDAWDAETTTANRSDALASCTEPMHTMIIREIKVISSVDGHRGLAVCAMYTLFGRNVGKLGTETTAVYGFTAIHMRMY